MVRLGTGVILVFPMRAFNNTVILSQAKDLNSFSSEVYSRHEILRASSSDMPRMTIDQAR